MDIEDMKTFVSVAELQSMSAAAYKLNHLQSNISAKIKKVETHYNIELFIRSSKGVKLTKKGEKLYHQYKKILLLWEQTESQMKNQEEKLRIGTMVSFGGKQISTALNELYLVYPNLNVTLRTGSTEEIDQLLIEGQIDIGFTIGKFDNKSLHYEKTGIEEMVIIGKDIKEHSSFKKALTNKNVLILSEKCLYYSILRNIYEFFGIKSRDFVEVSDPETLIKFASMGMGITLVPKSIVTHYNIDSYLETPHEFKYMDAYFTRRVNYELTPLEKQFIDLNNKYNFEYRVK